MITSEGQKRIVVTGVGIVGPLGCVVEEVWQRVLAGRSGIRNYGVRWNRIRDF